MISQHVLSRYLNQNDIGLCHHMANPGRNGLNPIIISLNYPNWHRHKMTYVWVLCYLGTKTVYIKVSKRSVVVQILSWYDPYLFPIKCCVVCDHSYLGLPTLLVRSAKESNELYIYIHICIYIVYMYRVEFIGAKCECVWGSQCRDAVWPVYKFPLQRQDGLPFHIYKGNTSLGRRYLYWYETLLYRCMCSGYK